MPVYEFEGAQLNDTVPSEPQEETVYLPINKEIADLLEVDGRVEFTANGVVREIDSGYGGEERYSIRVAIKRVEVYPENEFTELSKDDDDDE